MSHASTPNAVLSASATTSLRQLSTGSANSQQSILALRVAAKRQELENLKQLKDLSANLADQIAALEAKLKTLRDGTEAVACVLANWDNVLRAISMASMKVTQATDASAHDPKLPMTLVRVPIQQTQSSNNTDTNGG